MAKSLKRKLKRLKKTIKKRRRRGGGPGQSTLLAVILLNLIAVSNGKKYYCGLLGPQ